MAARAGAHQPGLAAPRGRARAEHDRHFVDRVLVLEIAVVPARLAVEQRDGGHHRALVHVRKHGRKRADQRARVLIDVTFQRLLVCRGWRHGKHFCWRVVHVPLPTRPLDSRIIGATSFTPKLRGGGLSRHRGDFGILDPSRHSGRRSRHPVCNGRDFHNDKSTEVALEKYREMASTVWRDRILPSSIAYFTGSATVSGPVAQEVLQLLR